ncbi:TonB family protein [Paludibaculum fermentans]|uniref:TonB family protein n=1 Tax=Paludibaculum fermentans TaxID=1473598 RepID=A0A7S7NVX2_PALFE|nr:TonB family protein [Paludibaculum fermentans]QOY90735.1 TonB family protein [Paludibaculum fermentans]
MSLLLLNRFSIACGVLVLVLLGPAASAQDEEAGRAPATSPGPTRRSGTPPKLLHQVEPDYTREAAEAGVQGTVVFEMVVNEQGVPVNIQLLSPLGFGLDEAALRSLQQWRFEPARKDGQPVSTLANARVNFVLNGRKFDSGAEEKRTKFNLALKGLAARQGPQREQSIKSIRDLAQAKFAPALYVLGTFLQKGDGMDVDLPRAQELIQESANGKYGPALFVIGFSRLNSAAHPAEKEAALRLIADASTRGSYNAQFYLGDTSERGTHGPPDLERASRVFRLCATTGHSDCQYRLGKLLLDQAPKQERNLLQAVAWLQLAADQGQPDAVALLKQETSSLTAEQAVRVRRLKPQLQQKP